MISFLFYTYKQHCDTKQDGSVHVPLMPIFPVTGTFVHADPSIPAFLISNSMLDISLAAVTPSRNDSICSVRSASV